MLGLDFYGRKILVVYNCIKDFIFLRKFNVVYYFCDWKLKLVFGFYE